MNTSVDIKTKKDPIELLVIDESKLCPFLREYDKGLYCSRDLKDNHIDETRRLVCDNFSLELYCGSDYEKCIYYQEGFI